MAWAQSGANSDPTYVALRNIGLGSEVVQVTNFDLKRDAGTFRLNSGTICFVPPVNGKVTGGVFVGDGVFLLTPPTETERKSLKFLSKEDEFSEKFEGCRRSPPSWPYVPIVRIYPRRWRAEG